MRPTTPALLVLLLTACSGARTDVRGALDGTGLVDLGLALDQTVVADDDGDALLLIELATRDLPGARSSAARVGLVVDTSGSMEGNKIDNARQAAHELIDRLADDDEFTLVAYGDQATVLLDGVRMRRGRQRAHDAVDRLEADGNTCTSCGMQAAYDALLAGSRDGVHRVLLLTDGHANRGLTEDADLRAIAARAHSDFGIDTAAIGLGRLHNEVSLAAIAEAGAADYYFLHSSDYLAELLDREIANLQATAVRDLVVTLRPGDGVAFGTTHNTGWYFGGESLVFDVGQLASGEQRRFVVELRLPPGDVGKAIAATATFADADGRPYRVDSEARLERSDDLARVEESIDAQVIEAHALLASAVAVDVAMQQLSDGNREVAVEVLRQNQAALGAYGFSDDIASEVEQMDRMIETLGNEPPSPESPSPSPAAAVTPAERGSVMLYRARSQEQRRGTAPADTYHVDGRYDLSEME